MTIASFEELCNGFCSLAGMREVTFAPTDSGSLAATIHLRGIPVSVLQFVHDRPDAAFLVAEFGTMPQDRALEGWLGLMGANLAVVGEDTPVFSRNPQTGEVLLQWACTLSDLTVVDVYQRVSKMVELALQWRHDGFLSGPAEQVAATALANAFPKQECVLPEEGAVRFEALCQAVCESLGEPGRRPVIEGSVRVLALAADGVEASVMHSPLHPGCTLVLIHLGMSSHAPPLGDVIDIMNANFVLMSQPQGATFSRDASTGELFLQYSYPLAGASAQGLLQQVQAIAAFAREGRAGLSASRDWVSD